MIKFLQILFAVIATNLFVAMICSAGVVTLDFEGYAPDDELGGVNAEYDYQMSGYDIWLANHGAFWNETSYYVENNIYPDSGSDWLAAKSISIKSLDPTATGALFDLISADIAEWPFSNGSNLLKYQIYTHDYDLISGEIVLDGSFGFEKIFFSDDFKNINYVRFSTDAEAFNYDNIVISDTATVVPLPSSLLLFLSPLTVLSIFRVFRKNGMQ